ncbi:MAG: glycosyltransferase family 4 protein [Planctomycetota bacterium]|nr:glycosyltransferase family 4 protein [Planctomycetota bacterium]
MRILVVSPFQPHPLADHGGGVYLGAFLASLMTRAEVAAVHFQHSDDCPPMAGLTVYSEPRLRNPEMNGWQLWAQRIRLIRDWGVRGSPLEVAKHRSAGFAVLLRQAITEFKPEIALVEFTVMAQYLPILSGIKTVFTDHERGQSLPKKFGPGNIGRRRDRRLWRRYVQRFYPLAGLCQALNQDDAAHLTGLTNSPVRVRPALVNIPKEPVDPAKSGRVLFFFGNYTHHPNPEAACHLAREVLPRVQKLLPDTKLWLAGPKATPAVEALAELEGVRVLGYVENIHGLMREVRCLVAPVFSGSGTRIKVAMAMAHGLPVVSNKLGLRGLTAPPEAVATGESADQLAAACVHFLRDPAAAAAAGSHARQFIVDSMGGDILLQQQLERFRDL